MKEQELNTLMSVVSDPIENVYKIESYKDLAEIQRIIRILIFQKNNITNTQCYQSKIWQHFVWF